MMEKAILIAVKAHKGQVDNQLACNVKLADLSDNMNLARIKNPSHKDLERIEKQ